MVIKAVIDTNVIVSALSSKSVHHWLINLLLEEKFELYVTDEILLEYEEVLRKKYSESVANNFLIALRELPNVHYTQVYYKWDLISDPDDNKFVDCAVAANVDCLVSHDAHFTIMKTVVFPKVNVITISEFSILTNKMG